MKARVPGQQPLISSTEQLAFTNLRDSTVFRTKREAERHIAEQAKEWINQRVPPNALDRCEDFRTAILIRKEQPALFLDERTT